MMASDKDILGKADALLRRHAGVGSDTGSVPVLTDLIDDPSDKDAKEELTREIFARVMAEVEARLASDLEKRLADQLLPHIHAAVTATLGDMRQELSDAIAAAVAAALERRSVK